MLAALLLCLLARAAGRSTRALSPGPRATSLLAAASTASASNEPGRSESTGSSTTSSSSPGKFAQPIDQPTHAVAHGTVIPSR
jgi:hypothetical protein